jgi:hypothetical protein
VQVQAVSIYDVETETSEQNKRRSFWVFSKGDAGWFVFGYVIGFLAFRFDMFGHGKWFRDPMPTARAALFAFLFAVGSFVLVKIRFAGDRDNK